MDLAHNGKISRVLSPQKIGLQSEQPKAAGKSRGEGMVWLFISVSVALQS